MKAMNQNGDRLVHATAADNQIRCMAAVTTRLVGEACRRHGTFPTASVALGRTLTAALLLGSSHKDLEKLVIHFRCDGPLENIIAQADAHSRVRGYVSNPEADATAMNEHGKFDVRSIVGGGTLYVTRDAGFEIGLFKDTYRGSVSIVSGEIAEDVAHYLAQSEQIPSAVSLGVLMSVDSDKTDPVGRDATEFTLERLRVAAAGGLVIQMMPSADERLISILERRVAEAPHATDMVRAGLSPVEMLREVLRDLDLAVLEERHPEFYCQCSRERALLIISALGPDEVSDMLERDRGAELTCHFCNEVYRLSEEDLRGILDVSD